MPYKYQGQGMGDPRMSWKQLIGLVLTITLFGCIYIAMIWSRG